MIRRRRVGSRRVCYVTPLRLQESFAASHVRRLSAHGNNATPATLASDHVLAAAKTTLDLALEKQMCGAAADAPAAQEAQEPAAAAARSSWHAFLAQRRAAGVTMTACSAEWRQMSPEAKAEWQTARQAAAAAVAQAPAQQPAAAQQQPPRQPVTPWPHCGDAFYPISEDLIRELPATVRTLHAEWLRRIGPEPVQPGPRFVATPVPTCEECFGRQRCSETLGRESVQKFCARQKRLDRWSYLSKPRAASFDGMWAALPMFFIGDDPARAEDGANPSGLAALMLHPRLKNQIFYAERCASPRPGSVINFTPGPENLLTNIDLIWKWQESQAQVALRVKYKQVGLAAFEVEAVEDLHEAEAQHARERAAANAANAVANAMAGLDRPAQRQARQAGEPGPRAARRQELDGGDAGEAEALAGDGVDAMDALDAHINEDPELQEQQAGEDNLDELQGLIPAEAMAEMVAEAAAEGVQPEASDDDDDDGEEEEGALLELPMMDANGQVRNPSDAEDIWGRISLIKEGTRQEAFSVYCRRHGCTIMRSVGKVPPQREMLKWFLEGQDIPRGREAALQRRHKTMFPA